MTNKAVLIIMDGYGIAPAAPGNAITTANKPNLDKLFAEYPHSQLISIYPWAFLCVCLCPSPLSV